MKGLTIKREVHFTRGRRSRKKLKEGPPPEPTPAGNVPRISRLMALAIRFEQLIASGEIEDQAELARLGHVSRARVTQIMNLLHLAPDIQEEILHLPRTTSCRGTIRENPVRPIATCSDWQGQRKMWRKLVGGALDIRRSRVLSSFPLRTSFRQWGRRNCLFLGSPPSQPLLAPIGFRRSEHATVARVTDGASR